MDFQQLFNMQMELDSRIKDEHSLEGESLLHKKVLALLVELGELANETRCFKFWSKKPPASHGIILEEYVDGLHFILSIGIELEFHQKHSTEELTIVGKNIVQSDQFLSLFSLISEFNNNPTLKKYIEVFNEYLSLGCLLGFTGKQMENAYYDKNEVNHQRQDQGY